MADDYTTPNPGNYTFRAQDVGGILYAVGLVGWGPDGGPYVETDDAPGQGLPVQPDAGATFPVSAVSLPLPSGAATAASQSTEIAALAAILSALGGTLTVGSHAVTNAGTFAVQVSSALPAGTNVIGHVVLDTSSAVIGHVVVDSGVVTTVSAVTAITNALPAGANLLGKVGIDQTTPGTTNAVAPISGQAGVAGGAGAVAATVQRMTLASDDPAVAALGATSGAAVITDANGTVQQYLRGLVKLAVTAGGLNVTKAQNNQTVADGTPITWQASGGTYALTCTSVTNNNGRQGAKGDLGATRAQRYAAQVTSSVGSAATNGLEVEVYWAASPSATAGTQNPGGTSGTDATFNTTPDEYKLQLQFIGSLVLSNNAGTGVQTTNLGPFTPRFRYGMPVIVNKSGQTLGGTAGDHTFTLTPMQGAG